jgi:hypothetical protein
MIDDDDDSKPETLTMLSLTAEVLLLNKPCPGLMQLVPSVVMLGRTLRGYKPDTSSCVGYST